LHAKKGVDACSGLSSQQDILLLSQKFKEGCKAVGLQLTDHLIMTKKGYLSFADEGLLYPLGGLISLFSFTERRKN